MASQKMHVNLTLKGKFLTAFLRFFDYNQGVALRPEQIATALAESANEIVDEHFSTEEFTKSVKPKRRR